MKTPKTVIIGIIIVALLAGGALFLQRNQRGSSNISAHEMEILVNEILPPGQREALASDPSQKTQLIKELKKLMALAGVAEAQGYSERPEIKQQLALQTDRVLQDSYMTANPQAKATDEEINAYLSTNAAEYEAFIQSNPRFKQMAEAPEGAEMKKGFAEMKVIAARARKDGLDKTEAIKIKIKILARSSLLAQAYVTDLQEQLGKTITDNDVDQYYKDHPEMFEEAHIRHILVSTKPIEEPPTSAESGGKDTAKKTRTLTEEEARKKAESILNRLKAGEDFAKLAQINSDDPGSKSKGGELGYFVKGQIMVPSFEESAFSLKPGEISGLVKTDFGYHIIKVEDRRIQQLDAKARQRTIDKLKSDKLDERIQQIADSSKIEIAENFNINTSTKETGK